MNLRTWFSLRDLNVDKGLCVTVASDGFGKSAHLMAVSVCAPDGKSATHYVSGAPQDKVTAVQDYTGVSFAEYEEKALGKPRADELLAEAIKGREFLVMYTAERYTRDWINREFGDHPIHLLPVFDVVQAAKTLDIRRPLPPDVKDLDELLLIWEQSTFYLKGGYKFDEIFQRMVGEATWEVPELERKVLKLRAVWLTLLTRDF